MSDGTEVSCAGSCLTIIFAVLLVAGISALFGWMTMAVLAAFKIHFSFWICWSLWILISTLIRKIRGN